MFTQIYLRIANYTFTNASMFILINLMIPNHNNECIDNP